jgi:hypothetical protein
LYILLSLTDKIKTVNNYHLLQASNKAAGGETARHQDTRAVSGELLRLNLIRIENTKDFWENIP